MTKNVLLILLISAHKQIKSNWIYTIAIIYISTVTGKSLAHFRRDIFGKKIMHLENSILHNRPVPKLAPLPQGCHKKNIVRKCARLFLVTVS